MIGLEEARQFAEQWITQDAPADLQLTASVVEFDLGYVVSGAVPAGQRVPLGSGRGVIDKETGELSVWPSIPVEAVIDQYRSRRAEPRAPRTWDPARHLRRDLARVATPARATHLTVRGRLLVARSMKGDGAANTHPLVRERLAELPVELRERGHERCSEVAAISDALHAEDAQRAASGRPAVTIEGARDDLFVDADLVTYHVREPGDPVAGKVAPPCRSCLFVLEHFGFEAADCDTSDADSAPPRAPRGWQDAARWP